MPIPTPLFLTGQNLAFDEAGETVSARLTDHARTIAQGVYQVAEQFYVAVGYGNANMTMVVGTDGMLLIDSLENAEAAPGSIPSPSSIRCGASRQLRPGVEPAYDRLMVEVDE